MKKTVFLTIVILCLLPTVGLQAQTYSQPPVEISKEKVRGSDGNTYYAHVVLEKQTLYAISKAYGVTVEEIEAANPDVNLRTEQLKKNSILRIPVRAQLPAEAPSASGNAAQPARQPAAPQPSEDEFLTHTVRWYEDIDDIAAKYGVSAELIVRINDLPTRKLKNRQKLRIPKDPSSYLALGQTGTDETPEAPAAEPEAGEENLREESGQRWRFPFSFGRKNSVNAVLLLPMKSGTSMDFYSGFLMALKELGEKGTGTELSVYDVSGGTLPVSAERLAEADIVFGPIAPADLKRVLDLADGSTVVVSPLDQKAASLVPAYRNLVQAPASPAAQYEDLIRWIREDRGPDDKITVISERNGQPSELFAAVTASGLDFSPFSYNILQGRNIVTTLGNVLSQSGVNRILIDSESEAFVNDVVRNLSLLIHSKYEIVVYSPSKIRSFDTIDVENLHTVSLHVSMSYAIDYDNPDIKQFLLAYRALFGTEPNQFAFQGYDLASYFIKACADHGDAWIDRLDELDRNNLFQANFRFREAGDGGYLNHGIRRAVYHPDFSVRYYR